MIDVITQEAMLARGPQTQRDLYELMADQIGNTMRIRRKAIDRTGVLIRVNYNRDFNEVYFSFGSDETISVNTKHHVAVKLDGVWKVLCRGDRQNWELN